MQLKPIGQLLVPIHPCHCSCSIQPLLAHLPVSCSQDPDQLGKNHPQVGLALSIEISGASSAGIKNSTCVRKRVKSRGGSPIWSTNPVHVEEADGMHPHLLVWPSLFHLGRIRTAAINSQSRMAT